MNYLSRIAFALMLCGVVIVMATGAVYAQDAPAIDQGQQQPQMARAVVASWYDVDPLEFYLALPVTDYVEQVRLSDLTFDSRIPQELVGMQEFAAYEAIMRGGPSVLSAVNFETAMWAYDNGIPQDLFGLQEVVAYESKLHGNPVESVGTLAKGGVLNWDKTNPVEYYGAYQIAMEQQSIAQGGVLNWDKTNPVEYYGAYQIALEQQSIALDGVLNWDKTNPVEYYGAYQIAMEQQSIAQEQTDDSATSSAADGEAACIQC